MKIKCDISKERAVVSQDIVHENIIYYLVKTAKVKLSSLLV